MPTMMKKPNVAHILILPILCAVWLPACNTAKSPAIDPTALFQSALLTATYAIQPPTSTAAPPSMPTETPAPTSLPALPTPDVPRTPPPLPNTFVSTNLNPLDTPHTYISDTCQYLKARWDPNNSKPGTVVMPIMFHSITDGEATEAFQITHATVVQLLRDLKAQGFEAINIQQLADFLYHNAPIPNRSVILIVDDRHHAEYFHTHFIPTMQEIGWTTVTNAWISLPDSIAQQTIPGNLQLQNEGWVDHQGHGVVHNIPVEEWPSDYFITTDLYGRLTAEEYIRRELQGSIDTIQSTFGKRPIAYIWPGGGFSPLSVQIARQVGYQLGFTVNPRGPLMYNWIPLADAPDPARPSYKPEGHVNDPLMVLPRYWDTDAVSFIDTVRQIGKEAAAYAEQNRTTELAYYDIVCKPITGEIPSP